MIEWLLLIFCLGLGGEVANLRDRVDHLEQNNERTEITTITQSQSPPELLEQHREK